MDHLNKSVQAFMDNQMVYDNPHNVEMTTNEHDAVYIASDWPGEKKNETYTLEIVFESKTLAEFIIVFSILSVSDLKLITPAFMLTLYHLGKADVCCSVDTLLSHFPLRFRKSNNILQATDKGGVEHVVLVLLDTPQQFIDYTQHRSLSPVI